MNYEGGNKVNNSILILFLLLLPISFISIAISLKFYRSIVSPFLIQMGIWLTALWLFVFFSDWLYFMSALKDSTVYYITFVLIVQIYAASLIGIVLLIKYRGKNLKIVKFEKGVNLNLPKLAIYAINIMSLMASVIFLINIIQIYGVNGMLNNSVAIRRAFFTSQLDLYIGTDLINILLNTSNILSGAYIVCVEKFKKNDLKILILPLLASMIFGLAYLGRVEMIKSLIVIFVSIELRRIKKVDLEAILKKGRRMGVTVITALFLFVSFTMGKGTILYSSSNKFVGTLKNLVSYATGSIIAFQDYIGMAPSEYNFGYSSFYPIYRRLYKIGLLEERLTSYVSVYSETAVGINTFTFLRPFHEDFGFLGIMIMPFLFMIIAMFFYYKVMTEKKPNFLTVSILLSFYPAIVFSIQGYEFQTNAYFIGISLAFIIAAIINKVSKKNNESINK